MKTKAYFQRFFFFLTHSRSLFMSCLSTDSHLGCFYTLAIVSNANTMMNMGAHMSFLISVFIFFG